MKAPLKLLALSLLILFVPFATAQAQAPSLSTIPNISVNAGATVIANVVAVDPLGRNITLTSSLPSFVTLNTPTSGVGVIVTTLTLAPGAINVGNYTAAVTASAGGVTDIEIFGITVNTSGTNQVPVVSAPPLREVTEGSNLNFTIGVSDADGDPVEALYTSILPVGATFTPNGSNTSGTFNWTPGLGDHGEYDIRFTAMSMTGTLGAAVTHIRVAAAPTLTITPIDDVTLADGSNLSVPVNASGPAGVLITLLGSLPSFATLEAPGSGLGSVSTSISLAPPVGSAGTYHASITASSSGVPPVIENFDIIVTGTVGGENHPPVLTAPASETVAIGSTLTFSVSATDADGDHVDLFLSGQPPGSSFVDHANNTGTFTWSPISGQGGTHTASFSGTDGHAGGSGSASTVITVTGDAPQNHAPVLSAPLTQQVAEGVNLAFTVTATDQDGDHVTLTANSVPTGATFGDQGNNTGTFSWTPGSTQSGLYNVAFNGSDGNGGTGTASTAITVTGPPPENHAPALSAPSTEQVDEGVILSFTVTATDQDGDHVTLTSNSVPNGAAFSDMGNNTGIFSWTPGSTQSGLYDVAFNGSDGHGGTGTASTAITVNDVAAENHAPVLSAPSTEQVDEGASLSFAVTATDQDGDHVTLTASSVPSGAAFSDQGDNTGVFSWTPGSTQSGVYNVAFAGSDGRGGTGTANTAITVNDVGGGDVPGKACLIASFKSKDDATCFRIRPVNKSFDLRDVVLSSITFVWHGASVAAQAARIELHCHGNGGHDDGDNDAAAIHLNGDHPHGDGEGENDDDDDAHHDCGGVVCGEHGGNNDHHGDGNGGNCDTLGIRACFSTRALLEVLAGAKMPCDLVHAEIHATLTSGGTVVATFGKDRDSDDGEVCDKGKDKGKDEDKGGNKDGDKDKNKGGDHQTGAQAKAGMNPMVRPNPLNPMTELLFTTSRAGTVRVTIYDSRGRLVKSLLEEFRSAGLQRMAWDGSNSRSQKVASGVYFFRIEAAEGQMIKRVAVVK